MPYLRFKGFDEQFLRQSTPLLVEEFARVAEVPPEIVKIELLPITRVTDTPRSLEILMFPRSQKRHDRIAAVLHELMSRFNYGDTHIFFILLSPLLYYKQGAPLTDISWLPAAECPSP